GTLQSVLDLNGIRFTGSCAKGCMLSMDKNLTKQILSNYPERVRMPKGVMLLRSEFLSDGIPDTVSALGLPLVVKPVSGGSSVGVSIVKDTLELESALKLAFRYEHRVLVEQYVSGREFSVGVLGSSALPTIEIKPKEGFYDYKNKYQQGMTEEICPAHITAEESSNMQRMALAVFEGLSLSAYARVDFIMTASGEVYCLEANTLPGMTPMSLLPQEAAADGVDFPTLCQMIVEESLKKYDRADS
ncbi:MAG: D-alanine--D-alanine ligase, partial [Clostridia bacterium]|nr:D-alanine--D-alanine ligase [Clostridia bacterium]